MKVIQEGETVPHYGVFELSIEASSNEKHPIFETDFSVTFTRPDSSVVTAEGYYDGGKTYKARAYANAIGDWQWHTKSNLADLNDQSGSFSVIPSNLKGQLRHHPDDPYQFAYDNGEWFLHIGDTGYRFVADTECEWKAYIDQASAAGFTKIRTWFNRGRFDVQALFNLDRSSLNLPYWQEIDRRMSYALNAYPQIIFQLIPYGEDTEELLRYENDPVSKWAARYAQARFSAFPNVHWCVSNDHRILAEDEELKGRKVHGSTVDRIAKDMAAREVWDTLLTNHQCRWSGYSFCDAEWSDMVILEDLDQVEGKLILEYRDKVKVPVINDEDRYEHYRPPEHPSYFFRRLMWASLLSGGHTTYCGTVTFEAYDGKLRGIQGYYDAAHAGKLEGFQEFRNIHVFFNDTGLTLAGLEPDDAFVGGRPAIRKCSRTDQIAIIYLANPNGDEPEKDDASELVPDVTFNVESESEARWFNPRNGLWEGAADLAAGMHTLVAPSGGDWVLFLKGQGKS